MLEAEKLFYVFFNKFDLFKEKLRKVSLAEAYKEYMLPKEIETDGEAKEKHAL